MPSPLDPMDPSGIASFLDTPEIRRQRMFDTLGGIGAALIQASGPTRHPRGIGEMVAAGLAGGAQAGMGSEDRYLRRAMVGSQVAKNQSEIANEKAWRSMFEPGAAMPPSAAASPAPSGPPPAPPAASGAFQPTLGSLESDNNPQAVNPQSGASGLFQFLPPAAADVRNARPDLNLPADHRTWNEDQQKAAEPVLRQLNAQALQAAGIPPTPATLYLAHRTGAQGAQTLLKADPNAPMASVVPAAWIAQNPDMQGKTVGQFVQMAQQRFPQGNMPGAAPGGPAQPAQYQPPQPRTMQEVINSMPPGVRQMVGAMGRKDGMAVVMKYADPGSEAVIDTANGQVVFIPKTMVGRDPRFQPIEGAKLEIERGKLANSQRATDNTIANSDVILGPDGKPMVNETVVGAKKAVSAAQGTDPASKITFELAQDAIKRNSDWQTAGVKAQSSIGRLAALQGMLDQITTGQFKGTTTQIKAIAKGAGVDLEAMGIKDDVGVSQAVTALTNLMALENRDPSTGAGMPGAMSDADRAYLQQATVSITKDPAGNKILIAIKKGDLQRQIDTAKYAREYIKSAEFKTNPAGLDDYVAGKIAAKDYYDPSVLPQRSEAPPGSIPPPPAGSAMLGAPAGLPPLPPGTRLLK